MSSNKLSAFGKRKLGKEAPTLAALNKKIESTKPKEKKRYKADIVGILDEPLSELTEEEYKALCRLARMRISLLVPLLQVMNNPGMKESVAHLPIWKQAQQGFRTFRTVETLQSRSDSLESLCMPFTPKQQAIRNRWRTVSRWNSWYWDKGIGAKVWFIHSEWINFYFYYRRNLRDPVALRTMSRDDFIFRLESGEEVKIVDSTDELRFEIWRHKKKYSEEELQAMSRLNRLVYYMESSRDNSSQAEMGTIKVLEYIKMSIPPEFVPSAYEHLADESGYLDAKHLYFDHYLDQFDDII